MTDHLTMQMHREKVRLKDKAMLQSIIERNVVATVSFHDDPYPYIVPMNYGYEWNDKLIFYFHMAKEGHRINLLQKNNLVCLNIQEFLDRHGFLSYQNENHDYRSVNVFGKAEIITINTPDEYIHGFSLLCMNNNRPPINKIVPIMEDRLFILKITADIITGKAQYPISNIEDIEIPKNIKKL